MLPPATSCLQTAVQFEGCSYINGISAPSPTDSVYLCRQKKANEKRLEAKKMKSQKKSDRRGKIDY